MVSVGSSEVGDGGVVSIKAGSTSSAEGMGGSGSFVAGSSESGILEVWHL